MSFGDEVTIGVPVPAAFGLALDGWDRRADARRRTQEPSLPLAE